MAIVPPRLVTATREQLAARERLLKGGANQVGWKLGMGERERMGGAIVVGHLTSATTVAPGGRFDTHGGENFHADVEAYVELSGGTPDTIGGYGLALEIVDLTPLAGGPDAIVATNIFHRAVSFGPPGPAEPSGVEVTARVNGELRATSGWPNDISARLSAAAEVLEAVGSSLRAGDRIITGAIVQVPIAAGDSLAAVIDGSATVTLDIV